MRENEEDMEGRLDSISHIREGEHLWVIRTFSVPEYGSTSWRDAMIPIPMNSANVGPTVLGQGI